MGWFLMEMSSSKEFPIDLFLLAMKDTDQEFKQVL